MASLDFLATELIIKIFDSLESIEDVLNLALTCRRFRAVYSASQLRFLRKAAEHQYGPLSDAVQLLTHNSNQPVYVQRKVSYSIALMEQIIRVGRVSNKWIELYPFKRWKDDYVNRRLLTQDEGFRARRALYRVWLSGVAFAPSCSSAESRLRLLRSWTTAELAEVADIRSLLRHTLVSKVCPSDGAITRKFRARHGDEAVKSLVFNFSGLHVNSSGGKGGFLYDGGHHSYANSLQTQDYHLSNHKNSDAAGQGWGDSSSQSYIVDNLMKKLNPDEILTLKEQKLSKNGLLSWMHGKGEWQENNGDTFGEAICKVLTERAVAGGEPCDLEHGIAIV